MFALPLTNEQHEAIASLSSAEALPMFDPRDNRAYFLVPADLYERLEGKADHDAGVIESLYPYMDEIANREGWDDPEMDAYDKLDPRMSS